MIAYALTIFTGAFLLFQVQPLIAKYILPWFGGGPGVWTTCLLFFQLLLLAGYAYSHLSIRFLSSRAQGIVHLALLAIAAALLPITPGSGWKPDDPGAPTLRILGLLVASVGAQGLVLASTGPLVQRWFSTWRPEASPYRLYALSNLGSLLALVSYPFLLEPNLSRVGQAGLWSWGFAIFAVLSALCALRAWRAGAARSGPEPGGGEGSAAPPPTADRILWLLLPFCGCVLLLAVTNQLTTDVAVVPFLWILPLGIYLLSFILAFDHPRWYLRTIFTIALPLAVGGVAFLMHLASDKDVTIQQQVAWYSLTLFVCCMVCHGELVRRKPAARFLTSFYLSVAAGGAAGGAFVALLAPRLFRGYFELHLSLLGCCVLAMLVRFLEPGSRLRRGRPIWAWVAILAAFTGLSAGLRYEAQDFKKGAIQLIRNFYGVLSVNEYGSHPQSHRYTLSHGSTIHGQQFVDPVKRRLPTTYYGPGSGVGLAIAALPEDAPKRIGAVGLGVGTIAAYGKHGDTIRFYEINPDVERLARTRFTYLADTPAEVEVVLGDARISMEREPPQNYDLLALDAFSGDAIPVHLLTKEAFEIFLGHLAPSGLIAVHISNAYLDLQPVLWKVAEHFSLAKVQIDDYRGDDRDEEEKALGQEDREKGLYTSTWVLLARDPALLETEDIEDASSEPDDEYPDVRLWTDDDTSLYAILKD